jgi:hypothetical protein
MLTINQKSLVCALVAVVCAFGWQAATVRANYGGNWTALFCVGDQTSMPDGFEHVYRFPDSTGFDGAWYYLIAHDPLMRSDLAKAVEYPGLRYWRIFTPGLAHVLALGRSQWITFGFIVLNLLMLFAGTWCACRYIAGHGRSPWWGLLFLFLPGVLVSLDRMTVDLAFAALGVGCLYFEWSGNRPLFYLLLTLLCLCRETGLVMVAGFALFSLHHRQWKRAALTAATTLPFLLWASHVLSRFSPHLSNWTAWTPFRFTLAFLWNAPPLAFNGPVAAAVRAFDLLALAGLLLAFAYAFRQEGKISPLTTTSWFFCLLGVYLMSLDQWTHVYDFGRVLSPLLLALGLRGIVSHNLAFLLPAGIISLRVLIQLAPQFLGLLGR